MGDTEPDSLWTLRDTLRIATGFVTGGFTAIHFDLGYIGIAVLAGVIVLGELVYGFASAWYKALQYKREKEAEENSQQQQRDAGNGVEAGE